MVRLGLILILPVLLFGQFNAKQVETLKKTYYMAKPYGNDYALVMAAIALQESEMGLHLVNDRTKDYGVFQINLATYHKRYGRVNNSRSMLINHFHINFQAAKAEIDFWRSVHGNNWSKVISSYNGGFRGNKAYAIAVMKNLTIVKKELRKFSS